MPLALALIFASCGRDDDSFIGKAYHDFTAFFNAYYNARVEYQRGVKAIEGSLKYDKDAPLEIFPSIESAASGRQFFERVVKKASIVLTAHPVSSLADNALLLMGKAYYYLKSLEAAERKFKEIITNYPDGDVVDEATFWYGRTLVQLQQSDEAKSVLGSVIASKKTSDAVRADAYFSLAELAIKEEKFEEAADEIERGLRLTKDDNLKSRAAFALAKIYDRLGRFRDAARAYQIVIDLDPPVYEVRYAAELNYAIDLRKQGKIQEAEKRLQRMLADDKNFVKFAEIRYELAECYVLQDRLGKAIELYIEIIRRSKKTEPSAKSYYQLGKIKQEISADFEMARAFYDSARNEFSQGEIKRLSEEAFEQMDKILSLYDEHSVIDSVLKLGVLKALPKDATKTADTTATPKKDDETAPLARRSRKEYRRSVTLALGGTDAFGETTGSQSERRRRQRFSLAAARDTATFVKYHKDLLDRMTSIGNFYHLALPMPDSAILWYQRAFRYAFNSIFELSDSLKRQVENVKAPLLFALADVYRSINQDEKMDSLYRVILASYPNALYANRVREYYGLPIVEETLKPDKALYLRAFAFIDSGRYDLALKALDSLYKQFPSSELRPKALLASGCLLYEKFSRPDSALAQYKLLASLYPESIEAKSIEPTLQAEKALRDSLAALADTTRKSAMPKATETPPQPPPPSPKPSDAPIEKGDALKPEESPSEEPRKESGETDVKN
ncbi:MAG: tetratricopeptide repeat protein [Chloroherpetonaceae bacterium]|nr:tetratricopeptide repeat protein [Chloroherpetonaceae bacterium]